MKRKKGFGVGKINNSENTQKGFTIIELMIATMIFSVIILVVTTGIIKIGNIYYKGIISSKTQDVTRDVMNNISSTVQFGQKDVTYDVDSSSLKQLCIGDTRYTAYINTPFKTGNEYTTGLVSSTLAPDSNCGDNTDCSSSTTSNCVLERRQLLGNNMRPMVLAISNSGTDTLWSIRLKVAYGDDDLLSNYGNPSADPATVSCSSGNGSSFCATADLDTIVNKRVQ